MYGVFIAVNKTHNTAQAIKEGKKMRRRLRQ
jgi:hypothetical protein